MSVEPVARPVAATPVANQIAAGARRGHSTPSGGVECGEHWHTSELASACDVSGLDTPSRLDPYWDGIWSGGADAIWTTHEAVMAQDSAGLIRAPKWMRMDPDEAMEQFCTAPGLDSRILMLGALHAWRTLSVEQLAAITGRRALLRPDQGALAMGFAAGLLDLGQFNTGFTARSLTARRALVRPTRTKETMRKLMKRLTWAERVAITGGQEWTAGGQYDRHNLLATELGLRAAEYVDVGTVLGERFSFADHLAGRGAGLEQIDEWRTADLSLIRRDGLRIAIEMTATTSRLYSEKVERWTRLIAQRPFEATGLVVVFVAAPNRGSGQDTVNSMRHQIHQAVLTACRKHPGTSFQRTVERIGVVAWEEWFPERHTVSDAFLQLRVNRPTGMSSAGGTGDDLWSACDLVDPKAMPFTAADPAMGANAVNGTALLGQTPYWLRAAGEPIELAYSHPRLSVGWEELPVPVPSRAGRKQAAPLRVSRGVTPASQPPPRLRGLAGPAYR